MSANKNRLALLAFAVFAIAAFAACTPASSTTVTPTAAATESPTPVPVQAITIDPRDDAEAFLAALPRAEVDCASSAVGSRDALVDLVSFSESSEIDVSDVQLKVLASCVSPSTIEKIVVGQLDISTGGLSQSSAACVRSHTAGIDFSTLFTGQAVQSEAIASTMQAIFCLTDNERENLESSDQEFAQVIELGGVDALECAIDGMGPTGIDSFEAMFGPDGTVDPGAVGQFMPLMIECGVVDDSTLADTGIEADQFACLFNHLDPDTLENLLAIAGNPNATPDLSSAATILSAFAECNIDLQALIDSADEILPVEPGPVVAPPVVSTDLLICLTENGVSASLAASYAAGMADASSPSLATALAICDGGPSSGGSTGSAGGGIVVPGGSGALSTIDPSVFDSLPITAEQAQCLVDEIGEDQLAEIANGTASPLAALSALGACNISITDLLAG